MWTIYILLEKVTALSLYLPLLLEPPVPDGRRRSAPGSPPRIRLCWPTEGSHPTARGEVFTQQLLEAQLLQQLLSDTSRL